MTDFIEYVPRRHGQRPPYWTPDTLTGLDNKNYVRQPNWAWIAGTTYYVPYEAVHGVPRPEVVEDGVDPVDPQDIIEALQAENAKLREALKQIARYDVGLQAMIEDGADTPENRAKYYEMRIEYRRSIARAALQETE